MKKKVIVYKTEEQIDVDYFGFLHGFSDGAGIVERINGQLVLPYIPLIQIENRTDCQLDEEGDLWKWEEEGCSDCGGKMSQYSEGMLVCDDCAQLETNITDHTAPRFFKGLK